MINESVLQEGIKILKVYAPNNRESKNLRQTLQNIKGKQPVTDYNWRFTHLFCGNLQIQRADNGKNIVELNRTIIQLDETGTFRVINNSRICIFLRIAQNIHYDGSHSGA